MFLSRLLRGVPKYRTSTPKKQTRKFALTRLYHPEENLVACPECGTPHLPTTLCMQCYLVVRKETNAIKKRMVGYDPYLGERQWHKWTPSSPPHQGGESAESGSTTASKPTPDKERGGAAAGEGTS